MSSLLSSSSKNSNSNNGNKKEPLLSPVSCASSSSCSPSLIVWPNVFDEGYEMILACIMLYGIVDLRTLARKGLVEEPRLLSVPISSHDIVQLVLQHKSKIEEHIGEESAQLYLDAFDAIADTNHSTCSDNDTDIDKTDLELNYNAATGETTFVSFDVVDVDDAHSHEELVYGICVDTARRRITVIFRGCTTHKDWRISAESFLTECPNPVLVGNTSSNNTNIPQQQHPKQPKTIAIHRGFYRYLFDGSSNNNNNNGINKFQTILDKIHRLLLEQYPGYHVYVTGHSLGGALATVFAFQAAAAASDASDWPTTSPITCIPIASPMVGNLSFETAFKGLEFHGRLRCLRITNHFDIFTQLPDRATYLYAFAWWFGFVHYVTGSCLYFLCCQNRVYRHVGMDLHLYDRHASTTTTTNDRTGSTTTGTTTTASKGYKIKHSKGSSNHYVWRVVQDWKKHWKQTLQRIMTVPFLCFCDCCCWKEDFHTNHGIKEHMIRLKALSPELGGVYLNDLYEEKRFTYAPSR